MSKIKFVSLGGLDERDNKCYSLSIDDDIFIVNVGIKVPFSVQLGVEKIIPDQQ
jgi:mRNA degradation ribonuclease J1/J2